MSRDADLFEALRQAQGAFSASCAPSAADLFEALRQAQGAFTASSAPSDADLFEALRQAQGAYAARADIVRGCIAENRGPMRGMIGA